MTDLSQDVTKVEGEVTADVSTAEGFFKSVYAKIRAEASHLESDAVAFEKEVQAKIDAFVAGIKTELQKLHSKV
jgi:hypothetical protein